MIRALLAMVATVVSLAPPAHASDLALVNQLVASYAPNATVVCDPQIDPNDYGLTFWPSERIELAPPVCLGVFLYNASPEYLSWFQYLNPKVDIAWDIGIGIVVTIHEAQHAAGYLDEWVAQCRAMRFAKPLLAGDPAAWAAALQFNNSLPPAYHPQGDCP